MPKLTEGRPQLPAQPKTASSLTKIFASSSPKSASSTRILSVPQSPSSKLSLGSPKKSPAKRLPSIKPFTIPSTTTPSSSSLRSPTKSPSKGSTGIFPKTPGKNSIFFPQTPSSHHYGVPSFKLYLLITNPPSKYRLGDQDALKTSRNQLLKLRQEETRWRCLLGRLGVAQSIWM